MGRKTPPPHEWGGDLSNYSFYSFALRTSRPAYWPQFGQTECGRFGCLQFGHGWIWTSASARCERRRPFFDLDSLTLGRATAREFYRTSRLGLSSSPSARPLPRRWPCSTAAPPP